MTELKTIRRECRTEGSIFVFRAMNGWMDGWWRSDEVSEWLLFTKQPRLRWRIVNVFKSLDSTR